MGRNSKRGGHSVNKAGSAALSIELAERPVHSDLGHDRVLRLNYEVAAGLEPELEEVLNTNESVLTAALVLFENARLANLFIPLIGVHSLVILNDSD